MRFHDFLERYVYVRVCPGCGELLSYSRAREAFCMDCRRKWDQALTENCPQCFRAISECNCLPKSLSAAGALCLRKLFHYSTKRQKEPQNRILYSLKHAPNRRLAGFLALEILPMLKEELSALGVESPSDEALIVHIPRGRASRNKYGCDQSEMICRSLSELSGIPHLPILRRKIGGKEQKKLSKAERQKNLKGLFWIKDPTPLRGRVVILLDDVVTTGASMAAGVSVLKKNGAQVILCFCVAEN